MMKFTALPVSNGDSFLLQVDNNVILVDGGKDPAEIIQLLEKENIPSNHIHLLVCTHYDADHIDGIIGILKSQKFTFTELWLPEIIGSLGYTLSKKKYKLFKKLRENRVYKEPDLKEDFIYEYDSVPINEDSKENNSLEKIDTHFLEYFTYKMNHYYYRKEMYYDMYDMYDMYEYSNNVEKMMDNMLSYSNLISSSLHTGAYIRWFKFKDAHIHKNYGYNLFAENAVQTDISIYDDKLFFNLLYQTSLSPINKRSLVFKFEQDDYPNILYTADSALGFVKLPQQINLVDNSIVTAPHHGSQTNDPAYSKISGKDLTFVRSYSPHVRPLSNVYKQLKYDKFCTKCTNQPTITKVELKLQTNAFAPIPGIAKCSC